MTVYGIFFIIIIIYFCYCCLPLEFDWLAYLFFFFLKTNDDIRQKVPTLSIPYHILFYSILFFFYYFLDWRLPLVPSFFFLFVCFVSFDDHDKWIWIYRWNEINFKFLISYLSLCLSLYLSLLMLLLLGILFIYFWLRTYLDKLFLSFLIS